MILDIIILQPIVNLPRYRLDNCNDISTEQLSSIILVGTFRTKIPQQGLNILKYGDGPTDYIKYGDGNNDLLLY